MKLIKNILTSIGALCIIFLVFFIYLGTGAGQFKQQQAPFINSFMHDFSPNWEISDVSKDVSNDLIKQLETPKGEKLIQLLHHLGRYQEMSDLTISDYNSSRAGKSASLSFKAKFSNGPARIEISIVETDSKTWVSGLYVTPYNPMKSDQNPEYEA